MPGSRGWLWCSGVIAGVSELWSRMRECLTGVFMGDTAGPDVSMADLSLLRLQWPVPVGHQYVLAARSV